MKKLFSILMILLLVVSCGHKGESSKAKFKIFSGNIIDPQGLFPGGLLVMGRSLDGVQSFIVPYSPILELDLKKGDWEFATIGWIGTTGPMEGNQQCSYQRVDIISDIFTVNFNMNFQSCLTATTLDGSRFSRPMFYNSMVGFNGFKKLKVKTCAELDLSCSTTNSTQLVPGSFRVQIPTNLKGVTGSAGIGNGMASNCVPGGISNIAPPHGGPNGFIGTQITTFSDSACSVSPKPYFFHHGFGQVLNQSYINSSGVPVTIRGALSVDVNSVDAGIALSPFMGTHSDASLAPSVTTGVSGLYLYGNPTTNMQAGGGVPSILAGATLGDYLYFDGTSNVSGWTKFTPTVSVKLLLQNY